MLFAAACRALLVQQCGTAVFSGSVDVVLEACCINAVVTKVGSLSQSSCHAFHSLTVLAESLHSFRAKAIIASQPVRQTRCVCAWQSFHIVWALLCLNPSRSLLQWNSSHTIAPRICSGIWFLGVYFFFNLVGIYQFFFLKKCGTYRHLFYCSTPFQRFWHFLDLQHFSHLHWEANSSIRKLYSVTT